MLVNEELKKKVWEKGQKVEGYSPDLYRKDACGAWIRWDKYGVLDNIYGWQIDHVYPRARMVQKGISEEDMDKLDNLRPMQHQNNASKGDDYPSYMGVVTSDGNKNIDKLQSVVVNSYTREILKKLYSI